jgi:nucleoid DNA-binding protein
MRLRELNDTIATACNVRANVVSQVQTETFRALRAALDKGEKVMIPDFGVFMIKEVPAEGDTPEKKIVRFRMRSGEGKDKKEKKDKKDKKDKAGRKAGKEGGGAPAASDDDDE